MTLDDFTIDCNNDVVTGDTILFIEAVFERPYNRMNPKIKGNRRIVALILGDSYGEKKQQHTYMLKVLYSDGTDHLEINQQIKRKGRNIYRYKSLVRLRWDDEGERQSARDEKHKRGRAARAARTERLEDKMPLLD